MMYHWESRKIQGNFEKIQEKWWVCVDCTRYGLAPDMLEGRCITVKGERKRLGHLADNPRPAMAYFRPWEVQDFLPGGGLAHAIRGLWTIQEPAQRDKEIASLRIRLKDLAAKIRAARPFDATAPSIVGWQRWALEPLDDALCSMAAADVAPLPANQFSRAGFVDFSEVFAMFSARPEPPRRRYV